MAEIRNRENLKKWLEGVPIEVSATLSARVALRTFPLILSGGRSQRQNDESESIALKCVRAVVVASAAAKYPTVSINRYLSASAKSLSPNQSLVYSLAPAVSSIFYASSVSGDLHSPRTSYAIAASFAVSAVAAAVEATRPHDSEKTIWNAVQDDSGLFERGEVPWNARLWTGLVPKWAEDAATDMGRVVRVYGEHWQVFLDWYDDRIDGDAAAAQRGRPSLREMEIEIATTSDEDWKKGSRHIFRLIQAIQEKYWGKLAGGAATLEEIASVASPTPVITGGKIDIAPNPEVDRPVDFEGLKELPATQIAIADVLLASLPGNAPIGMRNALGQYRAELGIRDAYPVIGVLRVMYAMICAERSASEADIWLAPSMLAGFDAFDQNHTLLIAHFPLQKKADEVLSRLQIKEDTAEGAAFVEPFRGAFELAKKARDEGVATDDVLKFAKATHEAAEVASKIPNTPADLSNVSAADSAVGRPTERQRVLGSVIGFFERMYNLLGTTVGIASALADTGVVQQLMHGLQRVLEALKSLASF